MRFRTLAAAAALGLAACGLSACATGLTTQVSRYQPAAIPAGASFYVVPKRGPADAGFYRYASMVSQQLTAQRFRPAGAPQSADVLVRVDYGVDQGRREIVSDPYYGPGYGWGRYGGFGSYGFGRYGRFGYRDPFYDPFWGVYYGRPYFSRWGGGSPFYYGWNDPYSYGGGVREYTVYKSFLDMDIVRRGNNAPLFEGHAKARSQTDQLDKLVPNLITAMFTGFPGKNGETVKITVPPKKAG
jgi:hypothetical protein